MSILQPDSNSSIPTVVGSNDTYIAITTNKTRLRTGIDVCEREGSSLQVAIFTLTIPLWAFITLYLLLILIAIILVHFLWRRGRASIEPQTDNSGANVTKVKSKHRAETPKETAKNANDHNNNPTAGVEKKPSKTGRSNNSNSAQAKANGKKSPVKKKEKGGNSTPKQGEEKKQPAETLDTGFLNSDGVYIKTKNRDSISQYV